MSQISPSSVLRERSAGGSTEVWDVRAVARVAERQGIGEGEAPVAARVERLECGDGDRLGRDPDPHVAVAQELPLHQRPADVEVEEVGRVEHLDHDVAAEAPPVGPAADEHARRVRGVRRAHHGGAGRGPAVDVRLAADEVLLLDVAGAGAVLRHRLMVRRAERIRCGADRQRTGHLRQRRPGGGRTGEQRDGRQREKSASGAREQLRDTTLPPSVSARDLTGQRRRVAR
jgi:hypothetical protein